MTGLLPRFLPDVPEVREDFNDYLGECLAVDAGLGVLLQCLEESGELEDTLIVVSGDHGIPGIPRAKCNLYDIGLEVPLAIRWPNGVQGGRVVHDFVNLMDLAPTLLEAAGVPVPEEMTAKSLWPILSGGGQGWVDITRDCVVTGRERHVDSAREGFLPYPQRAIRTEDHLLIVNFAPDRNPMGDPGVLVKGGNPIPYAQLEGDTHVVYADMDAGPTKAWMIWNREETQWRETFALAFGKRPLVELYDLKQDPEQMKNVAGEPAYADIRYALEKRLLTLLCEQADPRVPKDIVARMKDPSSSPFAIAPDRQGDCRFEHAPYAGPLQEFQKAPFGWPEEA